MIEIQFGADSLVVLFICNTAFADGASRSPPEANFRFGDKRLAKVAEIRPAQDGLGFGVMRSCNHRPSHSRVRQFPQDSRLRGCTYPSYHVFFLPNYVEQIGEPFAKALNP